MELVLGILLLFTFIMLVTIQTTHKSTINQKLIERRRSEYLHALAIAQNHPNNPAYRNLAIACGQAYAAVEDTTIFDESLLSDQLNLLSLMTTNPDTKPLSWWHRITE
jgi:hypothetical protein